MLTLIECFRAIGTATFGNIYTWSMGNIHKKKMMKGGLGFPFNQYCAFLTIAIMGAIAVIYSIWIPKSLNQKKTILPKENCEAIL